MMDAYHDESAYEWLQRARAAKRKLAQNPIVFPYLSSSQQEAAPPPHHHDEATNDKKDSVTSADNQSLVQDSSRFIVQDMNVVHLASLTFQCRAAKLNELIVRSQRWRRRRGRGRGRIHLESGNYMEKKQELARLENLFFRSFPNGTGIEFIDKVLQMNHHPSSGSRMKENIVLELIGNTKTSKTKILQVLAANYAAATSILSMSQIVGFTNHGDAKSINVPIVIFDPEHAIDFQELVGLVRMAIIRKWNNTSDLRQCYQHLSLSDRNNNECPYLLEPSADGSEYQDIENDIEFALDRIHIVRPKDISYGYVSALESIQQSLDDMKQTTSFAGGKISMPPVLLLFDSMLSAFQMSTKMLESLPNGSGLSGLNDFIRQVKKLKSSHETMIVTTRAYTGGILNHHWRSNCDGWNKMVTHRISIRKSASGSLEEKAGYDLVAIGHSHNGEMEGRPIPFSITSRGDVVCENRL